MTRAQPERGPARTEPAASDARFHVAGIGASAGGLEALKALFSRTPADAGIAYVVVIHLSPRHESHLAELLQPHCRMPVRQVNKTTPLAPDTVFVIPPNANLEAVDTHLRLSALEVRRNDRAPIDRFLCTLAATHDGAAVAVILTGGGTDGALGLRRIRERGGFTIAQEPAEAQADSMPRHAIATGMVDVVAKLAEIPEAIVGFCATQPRLPVPDADDRIAAEPGEVLDQILAEVRLQAGHDVGVYRRAVLLRRIGRRMQVRRVETLEAYLALMRRVHGEPHALLQDLSTNVVEFFGAADAFAGLAEDVIPRLFEGKTERDSVRVWSIGCSTGEEAFSLAMLLWEEASRHDAAPHLRVLATDLASATLAQARHGVYTADATAAIAPERRDRFFVREGEHYRLRREVRDLVVFSRHDLLRDPPFAHLDLVVCRELLRDLQPSARQDAVAALAYALVPRGFLLLGAGESIDAPHLFVAEAGSQLRYRRREEAGAAVALGWRTWPVRWSGPTAAGVHARLVERHGPASVLLDPNHQVEHYSARAGRFVRMPRGEPTHDILRLVREPLRAALRRGLAAVAAKERPWRSEPLVVDTEDGPCRVSLALFADEAAPAPARPVLLVFDELELQPVPSAAAVRRMHPAAEVARLEAELESGGERVRVLLDEERAARRQRTVDSAADAEIARKDVDRVLEELEAAREEMQAANEELRTLDEENRRRVEELAQVSHDLQNLLASTGIATLFLDREIGIVRFTPQAGEILRLRQHDCGRPLTDINHGLRYPELAADVDHVLARLQPVEREVASEGGRIFLARMLPYESTAKDVVGIVLSLIDVSERKRAEDALRLADRRKDEFLATLGHELRNPLAPIVTGIGVLRAAGADARVTAEVIEILDRQTRHLVRLVDDLLDVARITGGKLRLRKARVDLAGVARDAIAMVRSEVDARGHELVQSPPVEPVVLEADAARLAQVVSNLLTNAIRYTPTPGRIDLDVRREGGEAVIVVRDSGIGIPAAMLERVFEPFTQLGERQTATSGLGIGLTLARSLVELHGGSIRAASQGEGCGSAFTVRLPLVAAATGDVAVAAKVEADLHHVLVVDDNTDAVETLAVLLRSLGSADVRTAASGAEALRIGGEHPPDLMFVDLRMPDMDGFELARRVRAEPWGKQVRLVALSGWSQPEHRQRAREAGFDHYLTKPAEPSALRGMLARCTPSE